MRYGLRNVRLWWTITRFRGGQPYAALRAEFNDAWYRRQYPDANSAKQGAFGHYVRHGAGRQYSPNEHFNEAWYINQYPDVKAAVENGGFLSGFDHYVRAGREEGRAPGPLRGATLTKDNSELLEANFDSEWYLKSYPEAARFCAEKNISPFHYYLTLGIRKRHSPNGSFDEEWYLAFYPDVAEAVELRIFRCGFEQFLLKGRYESRLPHHKRKDYLQWKYPGIAEPVAISRAKWLETKLTPPATQFVEKDTPRINFLLPTLDSEIMFGGYEAALEWIRRFLSLDLEVRLVICDDSKFDVGFGRYQLRKREGWSSFADAIDIVNVTLQKQPLDIRSSDRFVAYSGWTAIWASALAKRSGFDQFVFLIQEYEPIFHANDSFRAVLESAYRLPHIPIFNTRALLDYFRSKRLGMFHEDGESHAPISFSFEHALMETEKPNVDDLAARKARRLLFYARPEAHAARNLFELGLVALREAVQDNIFGDRWVFEGIGTLGDKTSVELRRGTVLSLFPKTDRETYRRMLREYDIGLSLMMAPHPSLLPYEMASAGLVVVTNRYEYRDDAFFSRISGNIIAADADPRSLVSALALAVSKCQDARARVAGSRINACCSWAESISDELIGQICDRLW